MKLNRAILQEGKPEIFEEDIDFSKNIFNENHSAGLAGFIQYVPRQKGRTYQKEFVNGKLAKGTWTELIVKGGLERLLWSVSLSYSFSL